MWFYVPGPLDTPAGLSSRHAGGGGIGEQESSLWLGGGGMTEQSSL